MWIETSMSVTLIVLRFCQKRCMWQSTLSRISLEGQSIFFPLRLQIRKSSRVICTTQKIAQIHLNNVGFVFFFCTNFFVTESKKKKKCYFLKNSSHAGQSTCWQQNLCPRVYICILHRTIQCSMNKDKAYRREQRWSVQQKSQLVTCKSSSE